MNDSKPKEKFFHCGTAGHQKTNCPTYMAQINNPSIIESLVIEVSFIVGTSNSWCVDSDATNYICNMLQGFRKIRKLSDSEFTLHLNSKAKIVAVSVGGGELFFFLNKILVLNDYLFVTNIKKINFSFEFI